VTLNTLHQRIRLIRFKHLRHELHHMRISIHAPKRTTILFTPPPQKQPFRLQ
jgi:hypothetical protein